MKAISLWQPWASAVAWGHKLNETRHWTTTYRGEIAIHAAKRWTADEQSYARHFWRITGDGRFWKPMPLGAIVALARIVAVIRVEDAYPSRIEAEFGNYEPGRFAWVLRDVIAIDPIPYRGRQGLFDIPPEALSP